MKQHRICYIMRGYAGSGKSFLANDIKNLNENTEIVSADYFWNHSGKYVFDVSKLSEAHAECFSNFKKLVGNGTNVIIDNTNLKYKDIQKYIDYLLMNNNLNDYIYSVKFLEVSHNDLETAIKLRSNREDGKNIPAGRMKDMHKSFQTDVRGMLLTDYKGKIGLNDLDLLENILPWTEPCVILPDAILCDLDGTLAIFEYMNGIKLRSPYDASLAASDIVCRPVAEALRGFFSLGYEIIFVSGREDKFRKQTEEFLERASEEFGFSYDKIFMRSEGDFRKDTIIKDEIYSREILGKYNVLAVFDDRKSVVDMWRSKGLYVFDCNYRGKEF